MENERKMKAKTQRMSMFTGGSGGKWSPSILDGMVWIMCYCIFETANSLAISYSYCIMKCHKRGRSPSHSPSYESWRKHHSSSRRKYRRRSCSSSSSSSPDRRYQCHLHHKEKISLLIHQGIIIILTNHHQNCHCPKVMFLAKYVLP